MKLNVFIAHSIRHTFTLLEWQDPVFIKFGNEEPIKS